MRPGLCWRTSRVARTIICIAPITHRRLLAVTLSSNLPLIDLSKIDATIERDGGAELLPGMREMFSEAGTIWTDNENDFHFRDFIAADYEKVFKALALLKDQADTFLEFGSGLGIITSSAGLLGYEAYGIEIDPKLVRQAEMLAEKYETNAEFSFGSFIPDGYKWSAQFEDEFFKTILDDRDGYGDLDMELRDFDLVYGYPWPGERLFFRDIMDRFGRKGALFMTYDVREGIIVERIE